MNYLIRLRGHQQGPFTADQLLKLAQRGRFSRLYEVSIDDGMTWQRAEKHPELFPPPAIPKPKAQPVQQAAAAPDPQPEADENGVEWYYTRAGEELGPIQEGQLKQLVAIHDVLPDDYVWTEGMPNWLRVAEMPQFSAAIVSQKSAGTGEPPPVAPLAVASMILGILGPTCIGAILAIVFGHVSLLQIRQAKGALGGKGMAIAGLILGYLVVIPGVIFVLVYVAILVLAPTGRRTPGSETSAPVRDTSLPARMESNTFFPALSAPCTV